MPIARAYRGCDVTFFQVIKKFLHGIRHLRGPAEASTCQIFDYLSHSIEFKSFETMRVLIPNVCDGDISDSIAEDQARAQKA